MNVWRLRASVDGDIQVLRDIAAPTEQAAKSRFLRAFPSAEVLSVEDLGESDSFSDMD